MTVTNVERDTEAKTMTITAEFDAPVDRVWQLWEDPRQLERWWGPPTYPATFVDHDLSTGGGATYYMTGPEGDQPHGWWRVLAVDARTGSSSKTGSATTPATPPRHADDGHPVSLDDGRRRRRAWRSRRRSPRPRRWSRS